LVKLIERGFVSREGNAYLIEQKGVDYVASFGKAEDAGAARCSVP